MARVDFRIHIPGPECKYDIEHKSNDACERHDHEHEPVTVGPHAGVAASGGVGGLRIVEEASKHAGEKEGAKWEIQDENVVDETEVLEAKQLGRCRDGNGKANAVAEAYHDGAYV